MSENKKHFKAAVTIIGSKTLRKEIDENGMAAVLPSVLNLGKLGSVQFVYTFEGSTGSGVQIDWNPEDIVSKAMKRIVGDIFTELMTLYGDPLSVYTVLIKCTGFPAAAKNVGWLSEDGVTHTLGCAGWVGKGSIIMNLEISEDGPHDMIFEWGNPIAPDSLKKATIALARERFAEFITPK